MFQHLVYKCPKCLNTLLVSNKMLHDLRCTIENPATYENILFRQSQQMENDGNNNNNVPNSAPRSSNRMSITNEDGTMIDIKREKNMYGKEEFVETKYDKEGNILSRKKVDSSGFSNQNSFHDLDEYQYDDNDFDTNYDNNNNTYYEMNNEIEVTKPPSVIVETAEAQEIVYTAPAKYDPHVTINKPIEETIISPNSHIPEDTLNDIIRRTMHLDNNNNTSNYNDIQNKYLNGYNFSTTNNTQTFNYDQYYDTNNYNQSNQNNYDNLFNYDNKNNSGNNDVYSNNSDYMSKDTGDYTGNSAGMGNSDYNSYDFNF